MKPNVEPAEAEAKPETPEAEPGGAEQKGGRPEAAGNTGAPGRDTAGRLGATETSGVELKPGAEETGHTDADEGKREEAGGYNPETPGG